MKRYDIKNTAIPKRIIRHVCSKLFMPIVFGEKILTEGDSDNFIRPEGIEGYLACCLASTGFCFAPMATSKELFFFRCETIRNKKMNRQIRMNVVAVCTNATC